MKCLVLKYAFLPFLTQAGSTFWSQKPQIWNWLERQKLFYYQLCDFNKTGVSKNLENNYAGISSPYFFCQKRVNQLKQLYRHFIKNYLNGIWKRATSPAMDSGQSGMRLFLGHVWGELDHLGKKAQKSAEKL